MRTDDDGSISPAGDLFAFGISIIIVISLSSLVPIFAGGSDESLSPRTLSAILSWSGWDRDADGVLESSSIREVEEAGTSQAPFDGDLLIEIRYNSSEFRFRFSDGRSIPPDGAASSGIQHSLSVVVEEEGAHHPGMLVIGMTGGGN